MGERDLKSHETTYFWDTFDKSLYKSRGPEKSKSKDCKVKSPTQVFAGCHEKASKKESNKYLNQHFLLLM